MLFASSEDSEEPEKIIPGKEMGQLDKRILENAGDDAGLQKPIGQKNAQQEDRRVPCHFPVLLESLVGKEAFKDVRAIQGRNGEQVEQTERYVQNNH